MMAVLFSFDVVLFFVTLYLLTTDGFNLDPRFSVIKKGSTNSYFGYSVAQHQIVDKNDPKIVTNNVFLIGSPKQKDGGTVYQCDAQTSSETCDQAINIPVKKSADTDDQWLGVSVASQGTGKKAVACAHRFIKSNKGLGACYVLTNPLDEIRYTMQPCGKLSNFEFMKDFGLCQAGISAMFGQEDTMLIGAPGTVFWQGAMFFTNVTEELGGSQEEVVTPYVSQAPASGTGQASAVKPYSYQGYAQTMGRFDGTKALSFVSGAPMSDSKGAIVMYTMVYGNQNSFKYNPDQVIDGPIPFSGFGTSLLAVDINNDGFDDLIVGAPYYFSQNRGGAIYVYLGGATRITTKSIPTVILSRKMGVEDCAKFDCEHARFGMSLTKLGDINMDSFQDFAVGAPYEGKGAVYIYHGQKDSPGFTEQYVQRIEASDLPSPFSDIKSFGHSISGGMDLDSNGYPDLLVGAYESDAVALIRSRPIIRLHPKISVTPDQVNLDGTIACNLTDVKSAYKNRLCVTIKICLTFSTEPENSINVVPTVAYTLEAEKKRRIARAELQDAQDANKKVVTGKTIELKKKEETCTSEIALIKGSFDDKLNPIQFALSFGLSTDSKDPTAYPASATENINAFPMLKTEGADSEGTQHLDVEVDFVKECGDDKICDSNLKFQSKFNSPNMKLSKDSSGNYEMLTEKEYDVIVSFDLVNKGEAAYFTRVFIQKPEKVSYLETITKPGMPQVTCTDIEEDPTMIMCDQIGNPFSKNNEAKFDVKLNFPKELAESTDLYNITTWVNTTSTETSPEDDTVVLKFRVINRADIRLSGYVNPDSAIFVEGEPRGASAIDNEEDIGTAVQHIYIVRNSGPGVVPESYITIWWPYEVASSSGSSGKYLLYLMREPKKVGPVIECNDKEIQKYINPLKIEEVASTGASLDPSNMVIYKDGKAPFAMNYTSNPRRRRETEPRVERSTSSTAVKMSCMDQTAKCFEFKCKLGRMEPGVDLVQITFEARLWESTLLSDYRKALDVQIISWGNLTLPRKAMIQQDSSNDMKRAITLAKPNYKENTGQSLQWWIILLPVVVGIVLLLIVIFILYKVGFFKRKRAEEMQMYRAEKKQQQTMLNDYDDNL